MIKDVSTAEGPDGVPGASRAADGAAIADSASSADGVDLSLIRWMLSLTPAERLAALQGFVESALSLRDGTDGT